MKLIPTRMLLTLTNSHYYVLRLIGVEWHWLWLAVTALTKCSHLVKCHTGHGLCDCPLPKLWLIMFDCDWRWLTLVDFGWLWLLWLMMTAFEWLWKYVFRLKSAVTDWLTATNCDRLRPNSTYIYFYRGTKLTLILTGCDGTLLADNDHV